MAHSFSSISTFQECPRKYHETRVLKLHPVIETEAMRWGTEIHEKCELYIRDGVPIGETGIKDLQALLDTIKGMGGAVNCELEMSFDRNFQPAKFRSDESWFNGIADVAIFDGSRAWVGDYKTGGDKYPKIKQLELMALMVMLHLEEVQEVTGALLFIVHGTSQMATYHRKDLEVMKDYWQAEASRIEAAEESGVWPAKSSGLCPWCPCTTCEHWREKPTKRKF